MQLTNYDIDKERYAKCIEVSKRVRWDIDNDVIRGREFDFSQKFLPDGLSKIDQLDFLDDAQRILLSQVQGRTYANMFGFVERFITAKVLETTHAMMDELEWPREDSKISDEERDRAIDELIAFVVDVDGILQNQSTTDVGYFLELCDGSFTDDEVQRIKDVVLKAYRWQYIFSGVEHPRLQKLYSELTTEKQRQRVGAALEALA